MRFLRLRLDLAELEITVFEQIVDCLGVCRRDSVLLSEVVDLDDLEVDPFHEGGGVPVEVISGPVVQDFVVKVASLLVIAVLPFMPEVRLAGNDVASDKVGCLSGVGAELVGKRVGGIVRIHAGIGVSPEGTGEIDGGVAVRHEGAVNGNLVQIDPEAMVLRVPIEEHAELQQAVGRVFNARNHGARGEGGLFDIAVVILGVLVEDDSANFVHREEGAGPNLCNVEWVKAKLLGVGLLRAHDLNLHDPSGRLPSLDCCPEVALRVVGVFSGHLNSLGPGELLLPLSVDIVVLDVDELAVLIHPG